MSCINWNWNGGRLKKIKFKKWKHFEEYCENSTIHGLRYFPNRNIHFIERIWWIISVFCSMVACCILISKAYNKWNENPVIVTFSEKMTPLKDIPFPAVTICPETKTDPKLFNFSATLLKFKTKLTVDAPYYGLSEKEFRLTETQLQVCDYAFEHSRKHLTGDNFTMENIFELIKEVAPTLSNSLLVCRIRTYTEYCDLIFREVFTGDGLCFTFNSLKPDAMFKDGLNETTILQSSDSNSTIIYNHWSLEDGYDDAFNKNDAIMYPFRVLSAGPQAGLKVVMAMREDDMEYICRGPVQGFKIMLHSPNELPPVTGHHFHIPIKQQAFVSIKPNMIKTSKSLQNYSPERRQCYFNSERQLRYLKTYSQKNCEQECLANFTLSKCGCVKFSMPRDYDTPICGMGKVTCYHSAEVSLLEETRSPDAVIGAIHRCNCLPACTSISYDTEISQSPYEWEKYVKSLNVSTDEANGNDLASITIFFKENQFISSKRSELVGLTDFVASCGGLLGLFMGVSLLSIVEVVYYISLRLFCSIRTRNIEEKSRIVLIQKVRPKWKKSNQMIRSDPIWSTKSWYNKN